MMKQKSYRWKRLLALLLAMLLLFTGCGILNAIPQRGADKDRFKASDDYFEDVWRSDQKYSEIKYEHYERDSFTPFLDEIYRLAAEGGDEDAFYQADLDLWYELEYVYTLLQLAEIKTMTDPNDETYSEEYLYTQELYLELYDEYWEAMHAMAVSPHKELMKTAYHETYIAWFEEYVPYTDEEKELLAYNEEALLIQEYYELMSVIFPDEKRIGEIYVELVKLRQQQAELFGYLSYTDYAYYSIYGRDYTPQDAEKIWQGVKEYFVPLYQQYRDKANEQITFLMEADDLDCSPETILEKMGEVIPEISDELNRAFTYMKVYELYDIDYDPKKTDIGYTVRLYAYNQPFIFNAAYDEFYDYMSMIHEFGHFANAFYTTSDFMYGISDFDICELQSQGMEVIMTHYYDEIFGESYAEAAKDYLLMDMISSVIDGALFDEFQQKVYAEENLTPERVNEIYSQLYEEYGYRPYDGYETEWMWINHNFEMPFYYISYGVSALGALELYESSCASLADGIDQYLTVCAADTEAYYYSDLLEEVGLGDVFDSTEYAKIVETIRENFEQE